MAPAARLTAPLRARSFFAPLGQRVLGATEDGVGPFDEEAAEVFAAMGPGCPPRHFFIAAVVEGPG